MAAIARRTWLEMRTEALERLGRSGVSALNTRVEYWLDATYRLICQTWHHPELDKVSNPVIALNATASSIALPTDLYLPIGVRLLTEASSYLAWLQPQHARVIMARGRSGSGQPVHYARFGSSAYFDKVADQNYKVEVFYYASPTDPDFASGSPAINRVFDDLIVQGAVAMGLRGFWRYDESMAALETVRSYIERMAYLPLSSGSTSDLRESGTDESRLAGVLG